MVIVDRNGRDSSPHVESSRKAVEDHDADTITMDLDIKNDDSEVLVDQRALEGNWSFKCINRAVLVGTSINQCLHQGQET